MYSGFITRKKVVARLGIHQRFDMAAYRMIEVFLPEGAFPSIKDIVHFEGYYGPDGLKVKSPGVNEPSHLYDPVTDTGAVPGHIANHYSELVKTLKEGDLTRAAFEASWMAHYIGDGLTPAHHWPLEEKIAEAATKASTALKHGDTSSFSAALKKNWAIWGAKGHLSTHFNFEMGIAFALMVFPIRPVFNDAELARASQLGMMEYFKAEAREIAKLDLYEQFYKEGWNGEIASAVKNEIAPQAARTIGVIWLLALLEAGQQLVEQAVPKADETIVDDDITQLAQ